LKDIEAKFNTLFQIAKLIFAQNFKKPHKAYKKLLKYIKIKFSKDEVGLEYGQKRLVRFKG
jgi:hypothetical protein